MILCQNIFFPDFVSISRNITKLISNSSFSIYIYWWDEIQIKMKLKLKMEWNGNKIKFLKLKLKLCLVYSAICMAWWEMWSCLLWAIRNLNNAKPRRSMWVGMLADSGLGRAWITVLAALFLMDWQEMLTLKSYFSYDCLYNWQEPIEND